MTAPRSSRFSVPLEDLERSTRVAPEDLVEERPEQDLPHELPQQDPVLRWGIPF